MLDLLQRKVLEMEDRLARASSDQPCRVAVFDLDGTLLDGYIGEAVFAHLIASGHPLRLSWQEYQRQLFTHRSKSYRSIVQAMAGLDVETVIQATRAVMEWRKDYLTIQSGSVRKPTPRPPLAQLVSFLQDRQYIVYILSASNHISVQYVAKH
jgi:phosphoserine phosphatase